MPDPGTAGPDPAQQGGLFGLLTSLLDSAGLVSPRTHVAGDLGGPGSSGDPKVPAAVCQNCPICQAAAALDQINPDVIIDVVQAVRNLVAGAAAAMQAAGDQRTSGADGATWAAAPATPAGPPAAAETRDPPEPAAATAGAAPPSGDGPVPGSDADADSSGPAPGGAAPAEGD